MIENKRIVDLEKQVKTLEEAVLKLDGTHQYATQDYYVDGRFKPPSYKVPQSGPLASIYRRVRNRRKRELGI